LSRDLARHLPKPWAGVGGNPAARAARHKPAIGGNGRKTTVVTDLRAYPETRMALLAFRQFADNAGVPLFSQVGRPL
jgi:hypothetical protein